MARVKELSLRGCSHLKILIYGFGSEISVFYQQVIAHSLIVWDHILPTEQWLLNYLPDVVSENAFSRPINETHDGLDYETHR